MSDNQQPPQNSPRTPGRSSGLWIVAGFIVGASVWLTTFLPWHDYGSLFVLFFAGFVLTPAAIVLAIIRRTRRFGLGMLLACGIGWLLLGAMCGGLIG